jgi:dimethylhistidine N-methyltransferase
MREGRMAFSDDITVRRPVASRGVVDEALAGLLRPSKALPPKLFYDLEGCRLFELITKLPEYYLTRTERALLRNVVSTIVASTPRGAALVEYGASNEFKAELLLRTAYSDGGEVFNAYVAIDVASQAMDEMRVRLKRALPNLSVHLLHTDFSREILLPIDLDTMPRFGFFPGSTIGNLEPSDARRFLTQARDTLGPGSRFLIGVDPCQDPAVLIPAYNDKGGVTAAFNCNMLARLNREAEANFELDAFEHCAIWNESHGRIEMHLISRCNQIVRVGGEKIQFARDEKIHTENCYKYTNENFTSLAEGVGWHIDQTWTDPNQLFSVHLLV